MWSPLALFADLGRLDFEAFWLLGRFTVNFLGTTIMLTVYCDLGEGQIDAYFVYIKFAHEFASCCRYPYRFTPVCSRTKDQPTLFGTPLAVRKQIKITLSKA